MAELFEVSLTVNNEQHTAHVEGRTSLVDFLRNDLGFTGSHVGCEQGACGACTIEVDGVMIRSCLMLAVQANGCTVNTIESLSHSAEGKTLVDAFVKHNALQCGFCTPGMMASAIEYIRAGGTPDRQQVREHLSGNYCRCTGYQAIVDAVCEVAAETPVANIAGGTASGGDQS